VAQLFPDVLNPEEVPSRAERRLHEAFRQLPDEFNVFHSPSWIVPAREASQPATGEADFVLAHPDRGVVVLEVKGGEISFEPRSGEWTSRGRDGTFSIKDPFKQATRNRFLLLKVIERITGKSVRIPVGESVAFPDCMVEPSDIPGGYPHEAVMDAKALYQTVEEVERVFSYWKLADQAGTFGPSGISRMVRALAQPKHIRAPLGLRLADADRQLIELTEQQYRVLNGLSRNTRVCVAGPAGTGKSLLALEQSRRLSAQGHKVLLTCFNKSLAAFLAASVEDEESIVVTTFHQLCHSWAREAGLNPDRGPHTRPDEHFRERLPNLLMDAAAAREERFGAIVIDEGQDFQASWLTALELLLEDIDQGVIYLFGDDNQAIYGTSMPVPSDFFRFDLTENCRNTKAIYNELATCFPGQATTALGPPGVPVELVTWSTSPEFAKALSRTLHRIVVEEQVPQNDVVVLTGRRPSKSLVAKMNYVAGQFQLSEESLDPGDAIRFQSVHSFKGLESRVVVVCEMDAVHAEVRRQLWYTALSRARVHLVVLVRIDDSDAPPAGLDDIVSREDELEILAD
jgi:hypothetical protein